MSVKDKLMFWKKKRSDSLDSDSLGSLSDLGSSLDNDPLNNSLNDPLTSSISSSDPSDPLNSNSLNMNSSQSTNLNNDNNNNNNNNNDSGLTPPLTDVKNLPGEHAGTANQPVQEKNFENHNFELVLSKLDTIKANLDNINLRISKIENSMGKEKKDHW